MPNTHLHPQWSHCTKSHLEMCNSPQCPSLSKMSKTSRHWVSSIQLNKHRIWINLSIWTSNNSDTKNRLQVHLTPMNFNLKQNQRWLQTQEMLCINIGISMTCFITWTGCSIVWLKMDLLRLFLWHSASHCPRIMTGS